MTKVFKAAGHVTTSQPAQAAYRTSRSRQVLCTSDCDLPRTGLATGDLLRSGCMADPYRDVLRYRSVIFIISLFRSYLEVIFAILLRLMSRKLVPVPLGCVVRQLRLRRLCVYARAALGDGPRPRRFTYVGPKAHCLSSGLSNTYGAFRFVEFLPCHTVA